MDAVWLVIDSLGFGETSFAPDGPDTTPRLAALAAESGVTFTRAYAPGPASPSSHASFFTGRLPSEAGMHEACPQFDGAVPTVAEVLGDTHRTHLASVNPFLFTGLDAAFDIVDDLAAEEYLLFDSATDPRRFDRETDAEGAARYRSFLLDGGTPIRNLLNGLGFKLWRRHGNEFIPESVEGAAGTYRYASALNDRVRSYLVGEGPAFVVANYMDVHPPLSASEEAIRRFAPDVPESALPTGVRAEDTDEYDPDAMLALYRAAVWDIDRQVASLVKDLRDKGTFVIVTADHGPRFGRGDYLAEERLHVPLVVFAPDKPAHRVEHTVSLRSLPRTTMRGVVGRSGGFDGPDLLSVDDDYTAVTEYFHRDDDIPGPVSIGGQEGLYHDFRLRRGDCVLRIEQGEETLAEGDPETLADLQAEASSLQAHHGGDPDERVEFDRSTEKRLEDLGYL